MHGTLCDHFLNKTFCDHDLQKQMALLSKGIKMYYFSYYWSNSVQI
jgi:hypothetical protein